MTVARGNAGRGSESSIALEKAISLAAAGHPAGVLKGLAILFVTGNFGVRRRVA